MSTVIEVIKTLSAHGVFVFVDQGKLKTRSPDGALTPEVVALIRANKDALLAWMQEKAAREAQAVALSAPVLPRQQTVAPLSFAQQRLWLLDQIDGGSAHYNMPGAFRLKGTLDHAALNAAFSGILARHESLRTCFRTGPEGQAQQVIMPARAFQVAQRDLSMLPAGERSVALSDLTSEQAGLPFDLSQDLMLRAVLLKLGADEHVLLVTMHHIAADGWSMAILLNEFSALYQAWRAGRAAALPALPVQYADYASWQRATLSGAMLEQQLGYWARQLAGLPVVHSLPLDQHRPKVQTFAGDTVSRVLAPDTVRRLQAQCRSEGATLFMGLHAAFSALLARYSNETDIVVGSPIANREQTEVSGLIGFFVNTLVLRCDLGDNPGFARLLQQSRQTLLDAYAHQQVPFEQIVERLQPQRNMSHSPLFQIMLVLQNNPESSLDLPGLSLKPEPQASVVAKFDLTLNITESGADGLTLDWEYNTDLFEMASIERMARHFETLLQAMLAAPQENIFGFDMLSHSEREQILLHWNPPLAPYPADKCIHELFEAQVARNPGAIAVTYEDQRLSYGELNGRANRLAHYLIAEKQVGPDTLVGLCVTRSTAMLVGILAILKAGGAYVPLDPDYPEARLTYMQKDAALTTVLTQSALLGTTPVSQEQAVCLDDPAFLQQLTHYPDSNIPVSQCGLHSGHMAYVIYTSGSTGNPKGVMVEHYNVTRLMDSADCHFDFNASDVWTMFHSYAFDFSVWEIWGALLKGGTLVVVPYWISRSPLDFYRMLQTEKVTVLNQTPSAFSNLIHEDSAKGRGGSGLHLRYVVFGGEALNMGSLLPWVEKHGDAQPQLINMYGITETTVHVTFRRLSQEIIRNANGASLIGKPLDDLSLIVLNAQQQLVPVGVVGEMYVGGAGVTRGYLNQAELTASRFVTIPALGSGRYYRTGDLAQFLPNGELNYLGRIDHQVKIRGFRIELGEIENALTACEHVTDAVVLARQFGSGDQRLVAYVVVEHHGADLHGPGDGAQQIRLALIEVLRQQLAQKLPDYMVPFAFVLLENLPLTANGKTDRNALPMPDIASQRSHYVAPTTATGHILCQIWQEVLGVGQVGVHDNFFQLGGHSLLVMQVIARLQQHGLQMAVRQLFATPTLGELADAIDATSHAPAPFKAPANLIAPDCAHITPDMLPLVNLSAGDIAAIVAQVPGGARNVQDIYPLAPLQEGILFHHMMSAGSDPYVTPVLFRIRSAPDLARFLDALQFSIDRHDVLRTAIFWDGLPQPVQVVLRQATLPVSWPELTPGQDVLAQMQALCAPEKQWMDLTRAPLSRLQIAQESDTGVHFVLLQLHHLIDDATSLKILQAEIIAFLGGRAATLETPVPYREFVAHALHQVATNDAERFFRQSLGDITEPTAPFDLVDVSGDVGNIAEANGSVDAACSGQLRELARQLQVSPATLFHAAWAMVVAQCSGRDDVVFGSVMSGRLQGTQGADTMLGMFINTLPVRVRLDASGVQDWVRTVHQSLLDLLPYEQASLALAQRCSGIAAGMPLFSTILNYRHLPSGNARDNTGSLADAGFDIVGGQERSNYPFDLSIDDLGSGFDLNVQVDSSIDPDRIIGYMLTALNQLVHALREAPQQRVNSLCILPPAERQLLQEWSGNPAPATAETCLHQLFEAQAARHPDAVALVFEDRQWSYAELNRRANQLAHYLLEEKQVCPDQLIGVCLERSAEMIISLLAILKAGAAYVPLDPDYPAARLSHMISDAGLALILTASSLRERTPVEAGMAICLDQLQDRLACFADSNPVLAQLQPHHLAYVIYTSGSTGLPKGVMVGHAAISAHIAACCQAYGLQPGQRVLQFSVINFDAAQEQVWGALCSGASLYVRPPAMWGVAQFYKYCLAHRITLADVPPSYCLELLHEQSVSRTFFAACALETLIVGGDALSPEVVRLWRESGARCALINAYGPTETVITATTHRFGREHTDAPVSIGRPFGARECHVLRNGQLLPVGVAGELHIGGLLARGYLNQVQLSEEKFVPNPFFDPANPHSSPRLYKTGDLVRWSSQGELLFLGRVDHQIKIRGFRIEPGEIENLLSSLPGVREAVVMAQETAHGDKRLVAWFVPDHDMQAGAETELAEPVRQALAARLPDYMLPAAYLQLAQWPLTPSGKIDRRALPQPDFTRPGGDHIAPVSETAQVLAQLWQDVLGVTRVGLNDNFFSLGGHSLSATRLLARINQRFQVHLPLKTLFAHQTLAALEQALLALDTALVHPPILAVSRLQPLLPSYGQQRMWLLDQIDGGSAHYNMPTALRLDGELDYAALNAALTDILRRHESLRTTFQLDADGQVRQVVMQQLPQQALSVIDLSTLMHGEQQLHVTELFAEEAAQVFDLSRDLMLRARLLKMAATEHVLLVTMHHIASDGWSMAILINEFSQLYQAHLAGQPNPLPALPVQYADYAQWQRNWLQGDVLEQQLAYWTRQLAALPVVHSLPLDYPRPQLQSFDGDHVSSRIGRASLDGLQALCQQAGATLFMGLHAAFSVLLARYGNEHDIVIGSPIANREQAEVAGLIGFFVNTLVLRSDLSGSPDFVSLLAQSRQMLLDAYAHQQVPFEQIVERLQPGRSLAHSPLFQIMLVLQNNEEGVLDLPGLRIAPMEQGQGNGIAKYDLTLNVTQSDEGLSLMWEFNVDLFAPATIARMARHFGQLLQALVAEPTRNVFSLDLLEATERNVLLHDFNQTAHAFPQHACLHEQFEAQVRRTPEALALTHAGEVLSYTQLNQRANQLAHYLRRVRQSGPGDMIGVCMDRSPAMVTGILAILKAGAAYVPLDPAYPEARLAYMLEDARLETVLTHAGQAARLGFSDQIALCLDDPAVMAELASCSQTDIPVAETSVTARDLAYLIYTSGSTGQPKGVMIEHRNAVAFLAWAAASYDAAQLACVLASTSICFDLSVFEMFAPLTTGGSALIVNNVLDLPQTGDSVSLLNTVPSAAQALLAAGAIPASVRTVNLAGEPLKQALVDRLYQGGVDAVYDLYGPSEDTTYSTWVLRRQFGSASIGKAIHNTCLYVVNAALQLVPRGIAGELLIAGAGLARGYLNRPDLSAEKFVPNPFWNGAPDDVMARVYKTGDLVRWKEDGNLEYLGRIDHQVKIRGFRMELGEIQTALQSHPQVSEAVVLAQESGTGTDDSSKRLLAYVVAQAGQVPAPASLRAHLARSLPDYMLPAAYIVLERWPLTQNGKLDRRALPLPEPGLPAKTYVAPQTATEMVLCRLFAQVLQQARVGVHDNFFELGGHSLLALQLMQQIRTGLGVELALRKLFVAPTVAALAVLVSEEGGSQPFPNLVPIRPAGPGMQRPLFLIHPGEGEVAYAHDLANLLDPELPVYALAASGFLEGECVYDSVAEMAQVYLHAVRHVQPHGPYRLGGWSAGGSIAWEMAHQLRAAGETVQFLGLIDTMADYRALDDDSGLLFSGNDDADQAALLMGGLGQEVPESTLLELRELARSGAIATLIERCRHLGIFPPDMDKATLRRHLRVRVAIRRALVAYQPPALDLAACLFLAEDEPEANTAAQWQVLARQGLHVRSVPGDHYSMMTAGHIGHLARVLGTALG